MIKSLWSDTAAVPGFGGLERDEETDVLIVGGGMAGILCAYFLGRAGVEYLLCEGDRVASGTTSGTTAVLSAQHDTLYCELIEKSGRDKAKLYLEANLDALDEYRALASGIDCDFNDAPSHIYSKDDAPLMEKEVGALASLGFEAELLRELPLPIKIGGAVKFPGQAEFHPLKFIAGLAPGMNIREGARIIKIDGTTAYTKNHKIRAKKIIVASRFPIMNTHGLFPAKLYQMRSYIIALGGAADYGGTFVDHAEGGIYFRNWGDILLVGGGDHRTGKRGEGWEELRRFIRVNYPGSEEKYRWAAQDCMSLDGVPYIGRYSRRLEHVFVATGFNEWGMTTSMAAAKILCDLALGKKNRFAGLFDPSRSVLRGQLFSNLGTTLVNFLTPTAKRCPHLGCALKWNPVERTWDCPCHGSRFGENGKLLDNPATGDRE